MKTLEIDPKTAPYPLNSIFDGVRKSVTIKALESVERTGDQWDGGSRTRQFGHDSWGKAIAMPWQLGRVDDSTPKTAPLLPPEGDPSGLHFVEIISTYRGKEYYSVAVHPDYFERFEAQQPEAPALTVRQALALVVTAGYKGGYRAGEFARILPAEHYEPARAELREMGLLKKNNAITPEGRNAAEPFPDVSTYFWEEYVAKGPESPA